MFLHCLLWVAGWVNVAVIFWLQMCAGKIGTVDSKMKLDLAHSSSDEGVKLCR